MPTRPALAILLLLAAAAPAPARQTAPGDAPPMRRAERPQRESAEDHAQRLREASQLALAAVQAFSAGDYPQAKRVLTDQLALDPTNFVAHYNMACAHAATGDLDDAEASLTSAIQHGFDDLAQLRTDPHLDPLRSRTLLTDLQAAWPRVLEARRTANLTRDTQLVGREPQRRTLDPLRLELLSDHDETATDQSAAELALLGRWLIETLFPGLPAEPTFSNSPWVNVVLPDPRGFGEWSVVTFGPDARSGFSAIGGAYDHDRKRLVSKDLGATLRHEFVHVLHWRDMAARSQRHAKWIQEGLASLVEDYDLDPDGRLTPVPSWRTNMVKRLLTANQLQPLEQLAATQLDRFSASKPLAQYAHARAVFLYAHDKGVLADFYTAYTLTLADDPTGLRTLRAALGFDTTEALEADFRAWVQALPEVPETGSDLPATLGVEIEEGTGDGPKVVALPRGARERTGLALGSVITHINLRPTRDMHELIRVLGSYAPGDTITLSHRRGRLHTTPQATLLPRD